MKAKVSPALVAADKAKLFEVESATSMTAWLKTEGLHPGEAAGMMSTARKLARLPVLAASFEAGRVRSGHVRAVVENTPGKLVDEFADQSDDLVPLLEDLTVEEASEAMQAWKQATKDRIGERELGLDKRSLHISKMLDGRHRIDGELDADASAVLNKAIKRAMQPDGEHEPARSPAHRRADALVSVAWFYLTHCEQETSTKRNRPHLNITVNAETGDATSPDASVLPRSAVERWLCDSIAHRLVRDDEGVILHHGRGQRTATDAQWATLIARDGGCRAHGCDRGPAWCEAHHVVESDDAGPTDLDNLALICERHHHLLHDLGWHLELLPDATLEITLPSGRVLTTRPRGVDPPRLW
ncbi:MAG: DUF222 domain-containing protein [Actinomycetota bacterium]|nr:DUF222 domain-containing protein [Actinomycetota bacterium]